MQMLTNAHHTTIVLRGTIVVWSNSIDLPRFSSAKDYIKHADSIANESEFIDDEEAFSELCRDVWGTDE